LHTRTRSFLGGSSFLRPRRTLLDEMHPRNRMCKVEIMLVRIKRCLDRETFREMAATESDLRFLSQDEREQRKVEARESFDNFSAERSPTP
jgi:hypothetical protein